MDWPLMVIILGRYNKSQKKKKKTYNLKDKVNKLLYLFLIN